MDLQYRIILYTRKEKKDNNTSCLTNIYLTILYIYFILQIPGFLGSNSINYYTNTFSKIDGTMQINLGIKKQKNVNNCK